MSAEIDAREVLKYLNELGYCDITARQLKEFIRDLKILIKYDQKKHILRENQENINPASTDNLYYTVHEDQNIPHYDYDENDHDETEHIDIEDVAEEINTHRDENEKYLSEVFNTLHCNSTVSSRAKLCQKKSNEQNIISVEILKPKPSKPFLSSGTSSRGLRERPTSCSLACKTKASSENLSEAPVFRSSRSCRRPKSSDHLPANELRPRVSFIKPRKPVKSSKSDPVALYHQYQEGWKKQKLPGEDKRYDLRWAIRERMLGAPDVMPRTSMDTLSKKFSRI